MSDEGKIRWWRADAVSPPVDRLGRRQLHRFGPPILLQWMVTQGIPVDEVPAEYWNLGDTDDGYATATITCPCGQAPVVEIGGLARCEGCERLYVFSGGRVAVVNSPKSRPVGSP